jgi:ubiquinone/menaquinone biosynthesis C-methylase UbiE
VNGTTADRVRAYYDRTAGRYDASIRLTERLLLGDSRQWAASRARGAVLEVGIGTGRNLPFYSDVARLVGIDLSPAMLEIARQRARDLSLPIDLREGSAESLPFQDGSFETVVCTLTLCSVIDACRALSEMARVLQPGGTLVLVEHVRSRLWPVRLLQWLLEPVCVRFEQDHLLRDPVDCLSEAGFQMERCERSKLGIIERLLARRSEG